MEDKVRDAVFGNVGTMIAFRIGAEDAEFLEKEFAPEISIEDLVNLPKYHIYLKLMIDGVTSRPFLAKTLPPFPRPEKSFKNEIIEFSRKTYGVEKSKVEKEIINMVGMNEILNDKVPAKQQVYETHCQVCNKRIFVPFKPDGKRPVFCEPCLKKIKQGRLEAQLQSQKKAFEELPGISLQELDEIKPNFFSEQDKINEKEKNSGDSLKKKRKEPKLEELKEILKNTKNIKPNSEGEIEPGKSIDFD